LAIEDLNNLEHELQSSWVREAATPFIADLYLTPEILASAKAAARKHPIRVLLKEFPALGAWSVLYPLAKNYVSDTRKIYSHISAFIGEPLDDPDTRWLLKRNLCEAARRLGIPLEDSTDPTKVFFAPLGAPFAQHNDLAASFVGFASYKGPPAIEDTVAARHWQKMAVRIYREGLVRLNTTVSFDQSAHYARRFDAWRRGKEAHSDSERELFKSYERVAALSGRSRIDFVGPPNIVWTRDHLGLEPEQSDKLQSVKLGPLATQLSGGKRIHIPAPWPEKIHWKFGSRTSEIEFAPRGGEVLLFDADSGAMVARVSAREVAVQVPASKLVAVSRDAFTSVSFGEAIRTADADVFAAWIDSGEDLSFSGRPDLKISQPVETAIWFDGFVIGRSGSYALYACDGHLLLRLNPDIGGPCRIVRASKGDDVRYANIEISEGQETRLSFEAFGFDQISSPGRVTFEVLVPGAAGDPHARADLKAQCWVWPGIPAQTQDLVEVPVPDNFEPSRSAGVHVDSDGKLSVDPWSDAETPILALTSNERVHEFDLVARSEKLWHCPIGSDRKIFVPKGSFLRFGYDNRHDTLRLRMPDRNVDLIVLGKVSHLPFLKRRTLEIGASELEEDTGDDRIAIRRADGRVEILARLRRIAGVGNVIFREDENTLCLNFKGKTDTQAVRITINHVSGTSLMGDFSLDRNPVEFPPLDGVTVEQNVDDDILVVINQVSITGPARVQIHTIGMSGRVQCMKDTSGVPISLGIPGSIDSPTIHDLVNLTEFLVDPEPDALAGHLYQALFPAYENSFKVVGQNRAVGAIKQVLNVLREDRGKPRQDLVGVAPWIFEATPHAYSGIKEDTGLSSLGQIREIEPPNPLPDLSIDRPLLAWLDRVNSDIDLPEGLGPDALRHAFSSLRFRLRDTDLRDLKGDGAIGNAARTICSAYIEDLDLMRTFDTGGGGDLTPARIAVQLERFARASAERRAEPFVEDLTFRTGLSRAEVGYALTMMLRAGIEFFVYFRALWSHAALKKDGDQ